MMTGHDLRKKIERLRLYHEDAAELLHVDKRTLQRYLAFKRRPLPPRVEVLVMSQLRPTAPRKMPAFLSKATDAIR